MMIQWTARLPRPQLAWVPLAMLWGYLTGRGVAALERRASVPWRLFLDVGLLVTLCVFALWGLWYSRSPLREVKHGLVFAYLTALPVLDNDTYRRKLRRQLYGMPMHELCTRVPLAMTLADKLQQLAAAPERDGVEELVDRTIALAEAVAVTHTEASRLKASIIQAALDGPGTHGGAAPGRPSSSPPSDGPLPPAIPGPPAN